MEVKLQEIESIENFFESKVAADHYKAATYKFLATKFVFRSPSEHTVMGDHHDIEMQIKHESAEWNTSYSIKYAYVSVIFSVEDYDKTVTEAENSTI